MRSTRTLLLSLLILGFGARATPGDTDGETGAIVALIRSAPPWTADVESFDSEALLRASRRLLAHSPESLARGFAAFAASDHSDEDDARAFLLVRALFELPEVVPIAEARPFANWLEHPNVGHPDAPTYDIRWPLADGLRLRAGRATYWGRRYDVRGELMHFLTKYRLRDPSK